MSFKYELMKKESLKIYLKDISKINKKYNFAVWDLIYTYYLNTLSETRAKQI